MVHNHGAAMADEKAASNSIGVQRFFEAPVEMVFKAWTEPEKLAQWWWPARFHTTFDIDLRVGGQYRFASADLPEMGILCVAGSYVEVSPPHALRYTWRWDRPEASEMCVSVRFDSRDGVTRVTVTHGGLADQIDADNHRIGWNDCLDRLQTLIAAESPA